MLAGEMQIDVQLLTEADIPRAMELKNALGWNQTPEDWRRFLLLSPQGSFKALRGKELVGTAVAYIFDRVCWIGMLIVKEGCRHQGLGRELFRRCLDYSARQECGLVLLDATREGVSLYGSLGFRPEFLVGMSLGRIGAGTVPPAMHPDSSIRRIDPEDLDAIVSLEASAQGAVRRELLDLLLRQNPGRGFVCFDRQGKPDGFVLYRPGFHSHQVGPMIAANDGVAEDLLRAAFSDLLGTGGEAAVALTVPVNNSGMRETLRKWGLSVEPRLTRMSKGRKRLQAREEMVYALSGPEKG
jgi:GNAT superfamily N-acetyltransferase